MPQMDFVIAYVEDAQKSADLYQRLFEQPPVDNRSGFAMFVLPGGLHFGLWSRDNVQPKPNGGGGSVEIGFPFANHEALHKALGDWKAAGLKVLQEPTDMNFGRTFTVADGDGHRIRGYVPALR